MNYSNSQPLEKEDFVVELQMGLPNLSYFRSKINNLNHISFSNTSNDMHKSIGQFILNSEFFLTDKLGISLGFNYGYYYDYLETQETIYDGNSNQYITNIYFTEKKTNRYRVYIGPNFHFIRTDRLDTYFGIKAGIKQSKIIVNDNYPNNGNYYNAYTEDYFEIPVGLRICYGLRYFVTDKIAINTEFGLGGPLVSLGLTYKLTNNN